MRKSQYLCDELFTDFCANTSDKEKSGLLSYHRCIRICEYICSFECAADKCIHASLNLRLHFDSYQCHCQKLQGHCLSWNLVIFMSFRYDLLKLSIVKLLLCNFITITINFFLDCFAFWNQCLNTPRLQIFLVRTIIIFNCYIKKSHSDKYMLGPCYKENGNKHSFHVSLPQQNFFSEASLVCMVYLLPTWHKPQNKLVRLTSWSKPRNVVCWVVRAIELP